MRARTLSASKKKFEDFGAEKQILLTAHARADTKKQAELISDYVATNRDRLRQSPGEVLAAIPELLKDDLEYYQDKLQLSELQLQKLMYQPPELKQSLTQDHGYLQHIVHNHPLSPNYATQRKKNRAIRRKIIPRAPRLLPH